MNMYKLRLKHDQGTVYITTWATDEDAAIRIVMAAERCPRRAIKHIELVSVRTID